MYNPLLLGLTYAIIALGDSRWIEFEGSLYQFHTDKFVTWLEAQKSCESENASLVIIDTVEERRWLEDREEKSAYYWVGLRRQPNREYHWIDGPELDLSVIKWGPRTAGKEECAESDFVSLNTRKCDVISSNPKIYYVCEKDVDFDPCEQFVLIENDSTRTAGSRATTSFLRCDHLLIENWYRFESPSGTEMPTSCVPEFHCTTVEPVWMNGKHPTLEEGVVNREVCATSGKNCCNLNWTISVKNCSDYSVYKLPPTPVCYQAYCIGNEVPCTRGKTSENGWSPCGDAAPELYDDPVLSWRVNDEKLEVEYICDIITPTGVPDQNITYYVEWYIGEEIVHQEALKPGITQAILEENYLIGKLGNEVTCMVKGKTGDSAYSPTRESNSHFAGIEVINSTDVHVSVGDPAKTILIRPTLPVICHKDNPVCSLHVYAGITLESIAPNLRCPDQREINEIVIKSSNKINWPFCGTEITPSNWDKIHEIQVKATIHPQYSGTRQGIFHIYTRPFNRHKLWNNFNMEMNVQINGKNLTNNLCRSWNDPHMKTFDGWSYEHHIKGTFVLFRNKKTNFEVQTYYDKCINAKSKKPVMCNCAVAIKSSDMLLVIDRCDSGMNPVGYKLSKSPKVSVSLTKTGDKTGTQVYRMNEGRKYQIILPTGTNILVEKNKKHINIALRASHTDLDNTEGLCGTFNNDIHDDFTDKNGNVACTPRRFCKKFSRSWKISSEKKGLFFKTGPKKTGYEEFVYCKCTETPKIQGTIECDFNNDVQTCKLPIGDSEDITNKLRLESNRVRRSTFHDFVEDNHLDRFWKHDVVSRRRKRAAQISSQDKKAPWTSAKAKEFCEKFIAKTATGRICKKIPEVDFTEEIDFCILDIMQTGTTDWAVTALEAVKEECHTSVFRNMSLWKKRDFSDISEPPENILNEICSNECSFQGTCMKGVCVCNEGFMGSDCSVSANEPPEVFYIPQGGLCDIRTRPCILTTIYGDNFVNNPNLTCHMEYLKYNKKITEFESSGKIVYTKPSFESYGEIRCVIPTTTVHERIGSEMTLVAGFNVYISNDGHLKSDPLLLVIYDSLCLKCTKTGSCAFKKNTCIIDGHCHKAGDVNVHNSCNFCDPSQSTDEWSFRDELTCLINGICISAGHRDSSNDCLICNPEKSKYNWSEECPEGLLKEHFLTSEAITQPPLSTLISKEYEIQSFETTTISESYSASQDVSETPDVTQKIEQDKNTHISEFQYTTPFTDPTILVAPSSEKLHIEISGLDVPIKIISKESTETSKISTSSQTPEVISQSESSKKDESDPNLSMLVSEKSSEESKEDMSATEMTTFSDYDATTTEAQEFTMDSFTTSTTDVPSVVSKLKPSVESNEINIPSTTESSSEFKCPTPGGMYPNPKDCKSFYICVGSRPRLLNCPVKYIFNRIIRHCDHVAKAPPCHLGSS